MSAGVSVSPCELMMPVGDASLSSTSHIISPEPSSSALTKESQDDNKSSHNNSNSDFPKSPGGSTQWPEGSNNQLKLSVGYGDSEEDEEEVEVHSSNFSGSNMQDNLRQWHLDAGPSSSQQLHDDFLADSSLTNDRIRNILEGADMMFQPLGNDNFVEECYREKMPKKINGYLFGDVIGTGSYAKVKEVVQETTLVRRAVKIIKHARIRKIPNGIENVEKELRILKNVSHPNVIKLIEVFRNREKRKIYMVMDFCMGSVQQLLESAPQNKFIEPEAHCYFRQLVRGLEYLHSIGVIHKDIKPGNLLLSPDFVLKISDFGVAEKLSEFQADDKCTMVQGTPKFQAPELVSGATEAFSGSKADIWAAGVTLYNMVSGEYPFEGAMMLKLFDNIANQPLSMPSNIAVGEWLEGLLRGLLKKDPNERWNIEKIKHCEWFLKTFSNEGFHSDFNPRKISVYRPLTVSRALEQLYGPIPEDRIIRPNDLDETLGSPHHSDHRGNVEQADQLIDVADTTARGGTRRNKSFLSCLLPNRSP